MDTFIPRPPEQRAALFQRAGDELGIAPEAVEKDFWVCWVLREMFRLDVGSHLTFKGGTSLSKCYGLIERFSEDIDLVIDRRFLGNDAPPEAAPSGRERQRPVDRVLESCRQYISISLLPALRMSVSDRIGPERARLVALDPDDRDEQAILFPYEAVLDANPYVRPVVKIELGARSDVEPNEQATIQPQIASISGHGLMDWAFEVRVVAAERTFWEKVSLLHEESYRENGPRPRLARHYYDLWRLDQEGIADRALASPGLFERVVEHRRTYFPRGGPAQGKLCRGSIRLIPAEEQLPIWRADFEAMRNTMFIGVPPTLSTILADLNSLERRINQTPDPDRSG